MSETTGQKRTDAEIAQFLKWHCTIRVLDWQTSSEYLSLQEQLKEIIEELKERGKVS